MSGAKDERFKPFLASAESWGMNAPNFVSETSGIVDAQRLAQHICACLLVSTETGAEGHSMVSMVDTTLGRAITV